jgi:hypothetical protein
MTLNLGAQDAATADAGDIALQGFCQRLREGFPAGIVQGVSLYDGAGSLLWLTATFGPREDDAIQQALGRFSASAADVAYLHEVGQGRSAIVFRAIDAAGRTVGVAMVVVASGVVQPHRRNPAALLTAAVRGVLEQFAATREPPNKPATVRLYRQTLIPLRRDGTAARHELFLGVPAGKDIRRLNGSYQQGGTPGAAASRIERRLITELRSLLLREPPGNPGGKTAMTIKLGMAALGDDRFIRWVDDLLKNQGLPLQRIAFELDAAEAIRHIGRIRKVASFFHRSGFTLVLDNYRLEAEYFGLLRLPGVQLVKLAPQLMAHSGNDELTQAAIVTVTDRLRQLRILSAAG